MVMAQTAVLSFCTTPIICAAPLSVAPLTCVENWVADFATLAPFPKEHAHA